MYVSACECMNVCVLTSSTFSLFIFKPIMLYFVSLYWNFPPVDWIKAHYIWFYSILKHHVHLRRFTPSVLILRAVRTSANNVALNMTVPSLFRGMFMATSLWKTKSSEIIYINYECFFFAFVQWWKNGREETLHATLWGQSFPKPSGGWIRRRSVTTSRCLILPL